MSYPHCPTCKSVAIVHRLDGVACLHCGHVFDGQTGSGIVQISEDERLMVARLDGRVLVQVQDRWPVRGTHDHHWLLVPSAGIEVPSDRVEALVAALRGAA